MGSTEKYELWKKKVKDRRLLRELLNISPEERESAFYSDLNFGTAGIRGIMGVGPNRINIYTIRKITQGVVLYMKRRRFNKAAICYDSRINSQLFAQEAACVLGSAGITVYIAQELMPSPFLSFVTRNMNADIGIMITASHNPREYNGYKIYDNTGCQIREDAAKEISTYFQNLDAFRLSLHSFSFYQKRELINYIPDENEIQYLEQIDKACIGRADGLKVVYSPLNGTGYRIVPKVLTNIGCNVTTVPGQDEPSGKFSTCPIPNPEKKEALRHGVKLLNSVDADIFIATDPDADRIGVAYKKDNETYILNGNEIGILMCEYLLSHNKKFKPVIVRTLVSTDLADKIAAKYKADVQIVPTGFKYIGNVINSLEKNGQEKRFVLGFEESQGYLIGNYVRDKDAVIASKLMAIIACELKQKGKTLGDKLEEIYLEYGYQTEKQFVYKFEGIIGEMKIKELLEYLRENAPKAIGSLPVTSFKDYNIEGFDVPVNMLEYKFEGGRIVIRPSGTEPLIKLYASAHIGKDENDKVLRHIKKQFDGIFA